MMTTSAQQRNTCSSKATATLHFSWSPWSTSIRATPCSGMSPAQAAVVRRFWTSQRHRFLLHWWPMPQGWRKMKKTAACLCLCTDIRIRMMTWWVLVVFVAHDVGRWIPARSSSGRFIIGTRVVAHSGIIIIIYSAYGVSKQASRFTRQELVAWHMHMTFD